MPNTDIVYVRSSILILFLSGFTRYVHFEFYIINLLGHVKVALNSQVKHALGTSMSAFVQHMASSCVTDLRTTAGQKERTRRERCTQLF